MNWGITVLQGLSMLSGQSRPESGGTQLPLTTWIIPVVTCVIVLLAVAAVMLVREVSEETGYQYQPEQTTSAIICHHPRAKYFVAR